MPCEEKYEVEVSEGFFKLLKRWAKRYNKKTPGEIYGIILKVEEEYGSLQAQEGLDKGEMTQQEHDDYMLYYFNKLEIALKGNIVEKDSGIRR